MAIAMNKPAHSHATTPPNALFGRVASILEQAQGHVVRAVNTQMVLAYWLIGREIVQELQGGDERAAYGRQLIEQLSARLTERFGKGFSFTNLWYFRQFYLAFPDRVQIPHPAGGESLPPSIAHPLGGQSSVSRPVVATPHSSVTIGTPEIGYPVGSQLTKTFSSQLTWSHYRALMRVENTAARDFYEREAIECGWSKLQLERQIHSFYFERIVDNPDAQGLLPRTKEQLQGEPIQSSQLLKSPLVLEFLGLPNSPVLHESQLEQAIIDNLQKFLLELGKGFSFVARQKHIRFGDEDYYVDLVFYNYVLKCFLLVDLKMGKLSHADVGQMDGYVRLYEDQFKIPGDNPTIGLLLCSDKTEAVAKYSILNESKQIFATKYMLSLPTEEQLRQEIERERLLIESVLQERLGE
jgi:predicted nuclease of restriction endonuclease-like (RecB) superfamily